RRRLAHRHGLLGAEAGGRRRGAELRLLEQRNFLRRRQQDARPRERGRDLLPARGERQRRRADRDGHERGAAQTMNHRNLAKPKRTVRIPAHASRTLNLPNGESVALGCSVTDPVENVSTSCPMAGFLSGSIGRPMNVAMSFARWTAAAFCAVEMSIALMSHCSVLRAVSTPKIAKFWIESARNRQVEPSWWNESTCASAPWVRMCIAQIKEFGVSLLPSAACSGSKPFVFSV